MIKAYYDVWQQLVMLATPTDPDNEFAKIIPTDDLDVCFLEYPDGSTGTVIFRNGEWRFTDGPPPYDHATATGMYDR